MKCFFEINCQKFKSVSKNDNNYPYLLKETENAPDKIYFFGNFLSEQITNKPKIAIVGTRKATSQGKIFAKNLAIKLSELGFVIVSGLAMGIDTAAHEGAVEASGLTIAVLANGLDKIYPSQNENLAKKIIELGGAIISEYPCGSPALPHQFLERNRIICGLADTTIVVEAPERSGSLVTARLAAEYGREVLVVPGPANHPNFSGSHKLIRDGARLVASIKDILEDLNINQDLNIKNKSEDLKLKITDKNQVLIYEAIKKSGEPLDIDEILKITKLETHIVNQAIAFLIIAGIIKETKSGYSL